MFGFLSDSIINSVKTLWGTLNNYGIYNDVGHEAERFIPQDVWLDTENNLRKEIYLGLIRLSEGYDDFTAENFINDLKSKYLDDLEIIQELETFTQKYFPENNDPFFVPKISGYEYKRLVNATENYFSDTKELSSFVSQEIPEQKIKSENFSFSYQASYEFAYNTANYVYNNPLQILIGGLALIGTRSPYQRAYPQNTFLPIATVVLMNTPYSTAAIPPTLMTSTQYAKFFGGAGNDYASSVYATPDGGTVVVGASQGFYAGIDKMFVAKLWGNGSLHWMSTTVENKNYPPVSAHATADGGTVVAGYCNSYEQTPDVETFVAKVFGNGSFAWMIYIGGSGADYASDAHATTDNGTVVVGRTTSFDAEGGDIFVAKIWGNSTLSWVTRLGGSSFELAYDAEATTDGGTIVVGHSVSFYDDMIIAKIRADGSLVWVTSLGGTNTNIGEVVHATLDGGFVVAGLTNGFTGHIDVLVTKLWANGSLAWGTTFGGTNVETVYATHLTADGGTVLVGAIRRLADDYDILVVKIWGNGSLAWTRQFGESDKAERAVSTYVAMDGGIVISASIISTDAAPTVGYDFLIAKLDPDGAIANCSYFQAAPSSDIINAVDVTLKVEVRDITLNVSYSFVTATLSNIAVNAMFVSLNQTDFCFHESTYLVSIPAPAASASSFSPSSVVITPTSALGSSGAETSSSNISWIAGVAVSASVSLLAISVGLGFFLWKRNKQQKLAANKSTTISTVTAATELQNNNTHDKQNKTDIALTPMAIAPNLQLQSSQSLESQPTDLRRASVTTDEPERRINKGHTRMKGDNAEYALINKITPAEAIELKNQTSIEVKFLDGTNKKAKFALGKGQFGKLRIARKVLNGQEAEFLGVKKIKGKKEIAASENEGELQKKLNGLKNIMPLLDSVKSIGSSNEPALYQFMPLAGFGNGEVFAQVLAAAQSGVAESDDEKTRDVIVHVAKSLLTGFKNMHERHIYHLDFKPSNFVIDHKNEIYIIDFGCAVESETKQIDYHKIGDTRYFSPERINAIQQQKTFDGEKADAFALGLSLLEMLSGSYPFDVCEFEEKLSSWDQEYFINKFSAIQALQNPKPKSIWSVVKGLLEPNPIDRLTIEEALQQPIFLGNKHQSLGVDKASDFEYMKALLNSATFEFKQQEATAKNYVLKDEATITSNAQIMQLSPYPIEDSNNDNSATTYQRDAVSSKALRTSGVFAQPSRAAANESEINQNRYSHTQTDLQQQVINMQ